METVILITTRNYPCTKETSNIFKDFPVDGHTIMENLYDKEQLLHLFWNTNHNATWLQPESQYKKDTAILPVKYRCIDEHIHLYIAPCQLVVSEKSDISYLPAIITKINEHHMTKNQDYQIFVFCHDKDFGVDYSAAFILPDDLEKGKDMSLQVKDILKQLRDTFTNLRLVYLFQHDGQEIHKFVQNMIVCTNGETIISGIQNIAPCLIKSQTSYCSTNSTTEVSTINIDAIAPKVSSFNIASLEYFCLYWYNLTIENINIVKGANINIWEKLRNDINIKLQSKIGKKPIIHILPVALKDFSIKSKYFFDSNIIHHAISVNDSKDSKILNKIIKEDIVANKDRYKLLICDEYEKLNQDLVRIRLRGPHGGEPNKDQDDVIPFIFHSEQERKKRLIGYKDTEKELKKSIEKQWEELENKEKHLKSENENNLTPSQKEQLTSIHQEKEKLSKPRKQKKVLTELGEYKWRFLLVDDHAQAAMKSTTLAKDANGNTIYEDSNLNKLLVLVDDITRIFGNIKIACMIDDRQLYEIPAAGGELKKYVAGEPDIIIYFATTIEKAEYALQKYKFEIILLDYLLGHQENDETKPREYSYEILKHISEDQEKIQNAKEKNTTYTPDYKYGPHKRLSCMFISAFATAVNDRLLAESLHKSTDYWHIGDGACPTNTPYLFMHNLVHLMKKRLTDTGIRKLNISYIAELMSDIFTANNIRKAANEEFDKVLSLLYHYKTLMEDVEDYEEDKLFATGGSVLVTHFMDNRPYLGGLLEHLTQLVYLTAFGTIRQWPEMWNEYLYIRAIIEAEKTQPENVTIMTSLDNALLVIESYITELKAGTL